ncbi:alpha-L-glutamate ligase-like protein [Salidesulfovibrio onnuriiensis]|uniref:alpha-L-glutamate ligase-like protein n=1 Tax=Salidesulfovibrio onnuriiensis TaxID=2583823 RepID=UPI0011C8C0CC|nr:alpha-L-glutamate ligase-like protein [Salidesulfovibrio onnuriiensis]
MRFILPSQLRSKGVVGMNMRNVRFIAENNPRHLYSLVDDKLKTKKLAEEAGIAAPRLLGVVSVQRHVRQLIPFLEGQESFVVKPAKGSGGKGILVISGRDGDRFIKSSGERIGEVGLHRHVSNTLSGLFSLGGNPDVAMLEEKIDFSDVFDGFTFQGVPDIRVIVYKGYPVMAMARLSTAASDGKANLHQGAVGVGVDIGTGRALLATQHSLPVDHHPDTGRELRELVIPDWQDFLHLASRCHEMTGLGYLGVDLVLDASRGPLLLELNARPGLAIQMANGQGLRPRLELIETLEPGRDSVEERVAFSVANFRRG